MAMKVDEWRGYALALENKISSGLHFDSLAPQNRLLRQRAQSLENQLGELSAIKSALRAEVSQKDKELRILARALEIHAEELGIRVDDSTERNRKGKVLRAVAEAREECQQLAVEMGVHVQVPPWLARDLALTASCSI